MCWFKKKKEEPIPAPVSPRPKDGVEKPSPQDIINRAQIKYDDRSQTIKIDGIKPDVIFSGISDTNSMDGLLDYGHTIILSNNKEYVDAIEVGDVVVFNRTKGDKTYMVCHQLIETGDSDGWFGRTKGINNYSIDPEIHRRGDIIWVGLGIIW